MIACLDLEGVFVPEIWINVAERTGIPALVADPFSGMVFASGIKSASIHMQAPSLVVACGLATGGVGPVFAALLTDRLYGPRFGFLMGLQNIAYGTGATLGPLLAGMLFDLSGNYAAAFLLLMASIMVSATIISLLGRRTALLPR